MLGKGANRFLEKCIKFPSTTVSDGDKLISNGREWLKKSAAKRKEWHNKDTKPVCFKIGDLVLTQSHHFSSAIKGEIKKILFCYMRSLLE